MKPPAFDYVRANSVDHACGLLIEHGEDARLLAGGQSLIPMMNLRIARPSVLVDIGRLDLTGIAVAPDLVRIGALVRHRMLIEHAGLRAVAPIFAEVVRCIGHPTIRANGTAGGSVAHADPTAEIPALLVLLDGTVHAASTAGERAIAAAEFFHGSFETSLAFGEMITALDFSLPTGRWGGAYIEQSERDGDFALAGVGAVLECDGDAVARSRIVLIGADTMPVRADAANEMLVGTVLTEELAARAAEATVAGFEPFGDIRASGEFRKHLLGELTRRALLTAWARARGVA